MGIQNCQHCQTLEPFRTLITTLPDRFHVASDYILILPSVSDINSGTLFALAFNRFRLVILLFRFAPPSGLLPSVAGLSATRLNRFTATLPLLPKSAPPFTLPPVHLICCSTDLRREALRFLFCSSFLAGVPEGTGANQSPWKNNTITLTPRTSKSYSAQTAPWHFDDTQTLNQDRRHHSPPPIERCQKASPAPAPPSASLTPVNPSFKRPSSDSNPMRMTSPG